MRISDEQLEHWSKEFVRRGLASYMSLPQFLRDPEGLCKQFDEADSAEGFRPLLLRQRAAIQALRFAPPDLADALDELERQVESLVRRGDRYFEPMKHHAHPR